MKIKEIYIDKYGLPNEDSDYDAIKRWIEHTGKFIKDFPSFRSYKIKLYQSNFNRDYYLIAFDKKEPIALISFRNWVKHKHIVLSKVKKAYQGQGLGMAMYLMIINEYGAIVSDHTLTLMGKRAWERLIKMPSVTVRSYQPDDDSYGPRIRTYKALDDIINTPKLLIAKK
jgi:hypothetical protein